MQSAWKNELTLVPSKDHLFHFESQYFHITSIIQIFFFLFLLALWEENYAILLCPDSFIITKLRLTKISELLKSIYSIYSTVLLIL